MAVAYTARARTPATGALADFTVPFSYKIKEHVKVYVEVNGVLGTAKVEGVDYQWTSPGMIQFLPGKIPVAGIVERRRETPKSPMDTTFVVGTVSAEELNANDLQLLYITQEQADERIYLETKAITVPVEEEGHTLQGKAARVGKLPIFDAITGNLVTANLPDKFVLIGPDNKVGGMTLAELLTKVGTGMLDDGEWAAVDNPTDDGAWG